MAEKHPFDAFFGHGCVASHVASDPPPPPPPRYLYPIEAMSSKKLCMAESRKLILTENKAQFILTQNNKWKITKSYAFLLLAH